MPCIFLKETIMINNVFFQSDKYYLSYLETPDNLALMLDQVISPFNPNIGRAETAICITNPSWKCLILYDDHREGYLPIAHDLEACKQYWKDHKALVSHTSDTLEEEKVLEVIT